MNVFTDSNFHSLYIQRNKSTLFLLFLISVFNLSGQEIDNWYSADRAINVASPVGQLHLFTPYAPADGTPVNVWYELVDYNFDFTQNARQHPPNPAFYPNDWRLITDPMDPDFNLNPGFEYPAMLGNLNPIGAIPGLPTLRRNAMNFNPAVEFDSSGAGDALYFRSHARDEVIIFIVFSATGAGNSANTQSLLFGGDIDTYRFTLTNLSLGVSNGNRFSVGRTWNDAPNTFFQQGGIDLMGRPTIGTFVRDTAVDRETLDTWVNGVHDIVGVVRNDPTADESLFWYNRMGKHFNDTDPGGVADPSNLSGQIAEVLLMDGLADANHIQRMESYLAIKYGITLNASGTLGSISGNDSYNYLAADGTIIWPFDALYQFDIAGIGKDRFNDSGANRLRYNLHQRISKSVNTEARVTISTNADFGTDNLNDGRTPIDTGNSPFSTLNNYLVWGNDHGDTAFPTNVDAPAGVDGRIEREWRIIESRSIGANPIANVSVRVDLTHSDLLNYEACELFLIIDEDGNGDFTDGSITFIEASSKADPHVFFDNVNFNGTDMFTFAFLEDTEPPTGSVSSPLNVCDVPPVPDPNLVTADDNCAVQSIAFFSDVYGLGVNPTILTRTYRITDTSSNTADIQQTINIYTTPVLPVVNDITVCDSYALPDPGSAQYYDATGGPGGAGSLIPYPSNITSTQTVFIYQQTGTTPNCFDEKSFTVTVNTTPVAPNANDQDFCSADSPRGADLVPAISANITWYEDNALTTPVLSTDPLSTRNYFVTQTTDGCESTATTVAVTVNTTPVAPNANDQDFCSADSPRGADLVPAISANITWYEDNALTTPVLSTDPLSTRNYFVTQTTDGCESTATTVAVTVNTTPVAPNANDQDFCSADSPRGADLVPAISANITWYEDNALTTPVLSTDPLSTRNYFVTQTTDGCESTATTVAVTVNTTPVAPNANDQDFCSADSPRGADLVPAISANITWYEDNALTTPVLSTDPLSTRNYFVTQTTDGCESTATTVAVTVNTTPVAPNANDQDFCSADSPRGADLVPAISANITWYEDNALTTPVLSTDPLSTRNYFVTQTTDGCESTATTVAVTVNTTPVAPNANDQDFCSADSPRGADLVPAISANITWYEDNALTTPVLSTDPLSTRNYFVTQTTDGCESTATTVAVTVNTTPVAPNANDQDFCSADSPRGADLVPAISANITWYEDNALTTPVLSTDPLSTRNYFVTQTTDGCESTATTVAVTVNTTPVAPNANDQDFCSADSPRGADLVPAISANITWYEDNALTTPVLSTDPLSTRNYFVTQTTDGCESTATTVAVTVNTTPVAPNANDQDFCSADSPRGADLVPAISANITWYEDNALTTPVLSTDPLSTRNYFVTQTTDGCESTATTVAVTVNTTPVAPNANDQDFCSADSPRGADLVPAISANITWYEDNALTTPVLSTDPLSTRNYFVTQTTDGCESTATTVAVTVNTTPVAPNANDQDFCSADSPRGADLVPAISANITWYEDNALTTPVLSTDPLSTRNYFVTQTTDGCESTATTVAVTVNTTPVAPNANDQDFCSADSPRGADLVPAISANITWYEDNALTTPVLSTDPLSTRNYFVTQTTDGCESTATTVAVTVNTTPVAPNANDQDFCSADSPRGADLVPAISANITWYEDNALTTPVLSTDPLSTRNYFVTQTTDGCESTATTVAVTVNTTPVAPNANDQDFCSADSPRGADLVPAISANITWYEDNALTTPVLSTDPLSTRNYFVTQTTDGCESTATTVAVTVNTTPVAPNANDQDFCSADSPRGADLVPAISANITWYEDNALTTPVLSTDPLSTRNYFVTQTTDGCESTATTVAVTVNTTPVAPNANDQDFCSADSPRGADLVPAISANITWYEDNALTTPVLSTDPLSTRNYFVTQTTDGCESTATTVAVTVNTTPVAPNANDQDFCSADSPRGADLVPAISANITWYEDNALTTPVLSTDPLSTRNYFVTQTTDGCESTATTVAVTVNTTPVAPNANDQDFCSADSPRGADLVPAISANITWYEDNALTTPVLSTDPLSTRNYFVTQTTDGCESTATTVAVTVNTTPVAPNANDQDFCSADSPRGADLVPAISANITWYEDNALTTPVLSTDPLSTRNYFVTQTTDGCESTATTVAVTVNTTPVAPNANDQDFCSADSPRGADLVPAISANITWYEDNALTTPVLSTDPLSTRNYFVTQTTDGCESTATTVAVTVNTTPVAPNANDQDFCSADSPRGADLVPAISANITWYEDNALTTPVLSTDPLSTRNYFVTQTTDGCESTATTVAVTVNTTPVAPNANDQDFCSADSPRGADLVPAISANITWYEDNALTTPVLSTDPLSTRNYFVTQTTDGCESTATTVAVTVNTTPVAPNANDQDFCSADSPRGADLVPAISANITWYEDNALTTPVLSTDPLSTRNYFVTQTTDGCESTATTVAVTVNTTPVAPNANDQDFCSADSPRGADLVPAISANITWYEDNALTTPVLSTDPLSTRNYFVTQTTDGCESTATTVAVTVNTTPVAPNANDQDFCSADSPRGADLVPAISANITWYEDNALTTPVLSTDPLSTRNYFVTQTTDGCESTATTVAVTVNTTPVAPNANDQDFCSADSPRGADLVPAISANITWYEDNALTTPVLSTDPLSTRNYFVTQTTDGCESTATTVAVTVNTTPVAPNANDQDFCSADSPRGADLVPAISANITWYEDNALTTPVLSTDPLSTRNYFVTQTTDGCESTATTVAVTVNTTPVAPNANDQDFCSADSPRGADLVPAISANITWYEDNALTTPVLSTDPLSTRNYFVTQTTDGCESTATTVAVTVNTTPVAPNANDQDFCSADSPRGADLVPAISANITWYEDNALTTPVLSTDPLSTRNYFVTQTTDGCESTATTVAVTVNTTPVAPNANDQDFCSADSPRGADLVPAISANITWYEDNALTTPVLSTDPLSTRNYFVTQTTDGCESTATTVAVTVNTTPTVDVLPDVTVCDSFELPVLTNGGYFRGTGGTGAALMAGDHITTSQTLFIYAETGIASNCSDESSFNVTINDLSISSSTNHESCWRSADGSIDITIDNGIAPYTVELNTMQTMIFSDNSFSINGLTPGSYNLNITDSNGCQIDSSFNILPEGPNLDATVETIYSCDSGFPTNSIQVSLIDPSIASDVLYALDSTNPDDFVINSNFTDISPGNHTLSILHIDGCMQIIPFTIEDRDSLELDLSNTNINEITAIVSGGISPYTYFFEDFPGSQNNIFTVSGNGTFTVRVVDSQGCETQATITINFLDLEIPNFFTPNNDGQNDVWKAKNTEGFPNMFTIIYDRYGRQIKLMGPLDTGWDGLYESKAMPSGDYWYIIELNDGSSREFVGHFTLYR
ncbi:hypothetical protein AAY42_10465 [Flagellimonas eckloniae]|uniref:DUF8202 domain-containing protein n=2 Tax=Flagellimonas eckloniae TaxID=346185 RepID=A0A0Q0XGM2_9FLAO|nr:hypothetical protein AAY42_10465 [Allomuricauda eckloniae]